MKKKYFNTKKPSYKKVETTKLSPQQSLLLGFSTNILIPTPEYRHRDRYPNASVNNLNLYPLDTAFGFLMKRIFIFSGVYRKALLKIVRRNFPLCIGFKD